MRSRLITAGKRSVKRAAHAADALRPPSNGITVLIYHRVGHGAGAEMDLSPQVFERQLEWLAAHHRPISLEQALGELGSTSSPRPGVVLTFDDGTDDWAEYVAPLLEKYEVPATFYVATSFVDEEREFPGGGRPISWAGLREVVASGVATIGSHTHEHFLLDRLDPDGVAQDLDRSIELIGEHLDVKAVDFCYPKAVAPSPHAERAVKARFRSAVLAGTRSNQRGADPWRLSRSPIQASDDDRDFRAKATGGMHLEDDLRRLANARRYKGLAR
jgi:peptidoglycan/xylan/chitin deacetylase (PgdA/CDA1 family)